MARGRPHGRSKSDHRVCQEARHARAAEYRERIAISVEQQEARIAAVNAECDVQDAPQKRRSQKFSGRKNEAWTARGSAQHGSCKASGNAKKKAKQRLGETLGKAAERDLHSLHCCACGAFAEFGLRGGKEGGSVKYTCRAHATSNGCFRIDRDRAAWAEDQEMRRLRAQERRLEAELRQLGGASFTEKQGSAPNDESKSEGDWTSVAMSKSLITTLLMIGGIEQNPGPTPDEVAQLEKGWREECPNISTALLVHLTQKALDVVTWKRASDEQRMKYLTKWRATYSGEWADGWDLLLETVPIVKRGQDAGAGPSTDVEMPDAEQEDQSNARSDILASHNWAAISDARLKVSASSSGAHLEKSRDAGWFILERECQGVMDRAREAFTKLQTEPDQITSFHSDSHYPQAAAINKNKIPLLRNVPSLLVDRLPSPESLELTLTQAKELLEGMETRHTFQNLCVTSFMAASGYGKTRTALEVGCLRPGVLYFSCWGPEEVGSSDLCDLLGRLKATCEEGPSSWDRNQERVKKHVYAALLSRLKHLSECLALGLGPQQWLLYQLVGVYQEQQDTFAEAYNVLRHGSLEELQDLVHEELDACMSILRGNGDKFLILVLDEAQIWAKELPDRFSNGAVEEQPEGRPLLSAFLAVIAKDSVLCENIHVVLSGTGLSLSQSTLVASALMKVGSEPFPVVEFGTFNEASARKYLEDYAGPQDIPERDLDLLVGRRRFAARVLLDWAKSGQRSILKCLRSLVRQHTTAEGRELCLARISEDVYERHFLYGRLGALLKRGAKGNKLLDLLKRVAFAHARLGGPCLFLHHKEFDLVDLGFAKLHPSAEHGIVASIEEPLAVKALFNFLKRELSWSPKDQALALMAQSKPFPAMLGQWFEVVAIDQLPQLFQTDGALADELLFNNLKSELPECFRRGGASLARVQLDPNGNYSFDTVADPAGLEAKVRLATPGRGILEWLQNPNGVVFFFPETRAGPDLLFFVVVGGELYLVMCQLKLRWKLDSLARAIQTVDPRYLFEGKVNKKELREVAQEALRPERGVNGVISLFIGYPLRTRMREFVPEKTPAGEDIRKRKSKEEVVDDMVEPSVRVVIDGKRKTELLPEELRKFLDAAKDYGELEAEEADLKESEELEAEEGR